VKGDIVAKYSDLYDAYYTDAIRQGRSESDAAREADLEARFDGTWGTVDEIFSSSAQELRDRLFGADPQ